MLIDTFIHSYIQKYEVMFFYYNFCYYYYNYNVTFNLLITRILQTHTHTTTICTYTHTTTNTYDTSYDTIHINTLRYFSVIYCIVFVLRNVVMCFTIFLFLLRTWLKKKQKRSNSYKHKFLI